MMCKDLAMTHCIPTDRTASPSSPSTASSPSSSGCRTASSARAPSTPAGPAALTGAPPPYEVSMSTLDDGPVMTSAGYAALPTHPSSVVAQADTIVVPGHHQHRDRQPRPAARGRWSSSPPPPARTRGGSRSAPGAFVLAGLGKLDGREATTHWVYEDLFRRHFPAVRPQPRRALRRPRRRPHLGRQRRGHRPAAPRPAQRPRHRSRQPGRPRRRRRALARGRAGPVHRATRARRVRRRHRTDTHVGARAPRRADRPCPTWPGTPA